MSTPLDQLTHRITLEKAIQMTTLYRQQKEIILKTEYAGKDILPISETFNRLAFDALLAQPGCTAVRIYHSMDETLKLHSIVVGVDSQNRDILPINTAVLSTTTEDTGTSTTDGTSADGVILEEAVLCPPFCPEDPPSPLNP